MNEHTCARSLTAKLRKLGLYVLKLNLNYTAGVPDMWIAGDGGGMWIELKYVPELPKRDTTMVVPHLSGLQKQWLCDRARQAVRVCVILFTKTGAVILDRPVWWVDGIPASIARSRLQTMDQVAGWLRDQTGRKESTDDRPTPADPHPAHQEPKKQVAERMKLL